MAFFGKLRLSKATSLMLLFALVMGMMHISVADAQEMVVAYKEEAIPPAEHSINIQFCAS